MKSLEVRINDFLMERYPTWEMIKGNKLNSFIRFKYIHLCPKLKKYFLVYEYIRIMYNGRRNEPLYINYNKSGYLINDINDFYENIYKYISQIIEDDRLITDDINPITCFRGEQFEQYKEAIKFKSEDITVKGSLSDYLIALGVDSKFIKVAECEKV